jgi:hypothetical protein
VAAGELVDDPAGDSGSEDTVAGGDGADGVVQLVGVVVPEEEAAGARSERAEGVVVDLEGGEHDHPDPSEVRVLGDGAGGFDAVNLRHADVHENDVGSSTAGEVDGVTSICGLADDDEVVGELDQHAGTRRARRSGRRRARR